MARCLSRLAAGFCWRGAFRLEFDFISVVPPPRQHRCPAGSLRFSLGPRNTPSLTMEGPQAQRSSMRAFTAVVQKCADTGLYVEYVPGFAGAHSQGESLDELRGNLGEVFEEGEPLLNAEFVGTQTIQVG